MKNLFDIINNILKIISAVILILFFMIPELMDSLCTFSILNYITYDS